MKALIAFLLTGLMVIFSLILKLASVVFPFVIILWLIDVLSLTIVFNNLWVILGSLLGVLVAFCGISLAGGNK